MILKIRTHYIIVYFILPYFCRPCLIHPTRPFSNPSWTLLLCGCIIIDKTQVIAVSPVPQYKCTETCVQFTCMYNRTTGSSKVRVPQDKKNTQNLISRFPSVGL